MPYIVGIDGGGTKTALCAVDLDTAAYHSTTIGSADPRAARAEHVPAAIREALHAMIGDAPVVCAAAGMPCYGESPSLDARMQAGLRTVFPCPHVIVNDVEVALAGSLGLQPGIHIVAGTGSIAMGRDEQGRTARAGGWDEFYSDEGSGCWLGRKTMQLFSQQSDGRVPQGPLYEIIRRELALQDDFEFIDAVRSGIIGNRSATAAFQLYLKHAAQAGDASAVALYEHAAQELFRMILAVQEALSFPAQGWVASHSGGLFHSGFVLEPLTRRIAGRGGRMVPPIFPPEHGALLLAAQHSIPARLEALKTFLKRLER